MDDFLFWLAAVDLGFRPARVLTLTATPSPGRYQTPEAALQYYGAAVDAIRGVPGVESAASAVGVPLTSGGWQFSMRRPGEQLIDDLDRLLARVGLAHDVDAVRVEQELQPRAHDVVVVDDDGSDLAHRLPL